MSPISPPGVSLRGSPRKILVFSIRALTDAYPGSSVPVAADAFAGDVFDREAPK